MLPTDQLIRKATTTTTNLASIIPILWASQMETNLRRRSVLSQSLVVNTDLLVPGAGDRVYIPALPDITIADALTEGTDMTIYALSNSANVTLTPTEYGKTIEITRKALDRIKYDGMAAIVDRLAYAMSIRIETAVANLWNATSVALPNSTTVFGGSSLTAIPQIYPNGHATGTIVSTDTLTAASLRKGVASLMQYDNVPFADGNYNLYLTPDAYYGLLQDATILVDIRYGEPSAIMAGVNGYQAHIYGVNLIMTNYIATSSEGAGSAVTVNNNLLVADRWGAIAYKRRPEIVVDPTLYDMGRRRRFGVTGDHDIELLHPARAQVLKSAKQF
jgi:hypothetical protein